MRLFGLDMSDLIAYEPVIEKVVKTLHNFKGARAGETVMIPRVVADVGDQEWEIEAHRAKRLK